MKSYSHACGGFDRTIVVGDIHGCYVEFQELCHLVNFGAQDALVTVGDFLDRGPDSWKVAAFFRDLPNAFSVLGNHERRVAGTIHGTSKPAWSQEQTLSLLPKEEWDHWACFLGQLPAVFETDHVLITHARLDPTRPIMDQDPYYTAGVGGDTVRIELDSSVVPLWFAEISPMLKKPLCMGHIGYSRVELVPGSLFPTIAGMQATDSRQRRHGSGMLRPMNNRTNCGRVLIERVMALDLYHRMANLPSFLGD